ncbi:MAG: hypothetical protein IJ343_03550 [Clostridia bacterium]|nr:hypothetical protein [Clostridia bacterium]
MKVVLRHVNRNGTLLQTPLNSRLPELRTARDPISIQGRTLRDRYEALCPRYDVKYWR